MLIDFTRHFSRGELYSLLIKARFDKEVSCGQLTDGAFNRRKAARREHLGKRAYDRGQGNWGCDFHPSKGRRQARKDRRKPVE